jgi:hypothetical protein
VFVALFVPFAYFNHSEGWNQGARLAALHAIVMQGTLRIDAYHEITGDKALIGGHYYSEKAPAIVLAALPAFAITAGMQRAAGIDPDSPTAWRQSEWIATAASVGVLAALGGVAFFLTLAGSLGVPVALVSTLAVFLGTIVFPYATAMFAHAGTVGFLCLALWAMLERPSRRRDYLAGALAALAVASEYPAILPFAALLAFAAHDDRGRAWRFALGAAPVVVLLLANNYAVGGSPFRVGYGSNPAFPQITAGNAFGFHLPNLEAAKRLLWGEYRGLLFWSPVLLMALPGIFMLWRRHLAMAAVVVSVVAMLLLQVSSFSGWTGGNAVGPRYLAPALPFIGLAAAHGIKRWPLIGSALAVASIALMLFVTAIALDPPEDVMTPLHSFYLIRWRDNRLAENLGTLLGLSQMASLVVPLGVSLAAATAIVMRRERDGWR